MRASITKPLVAVAVAAALIIAGSPAAAQAATDERTSLPLSVVTSSSKSLAVVPFAIKNQKSKKYLQPSGGSTANGTTIVQESASSNHTQGWVLYADGSYVTYNNYGVNRNMGTAGTSTASGTHAVIVNGSGSFDQDWIVDPKDSTYFRLKNRKDASKCLGINNGSIDAHAIAAVFTCDTSTNQTWSYTNF